MNFFLFHENSHELNLKANGMSFNPILSRLKHVSNKIFQVRHFSENCGQRKNIDFGSSLRTARAAPKLFNTHEKPLKAYEKSDFAIFYIQLSAFPRLISESKIFISSIHIWTLFFWISDQIQFSFFENMHFHHVYRNMERNFIEIIIHVIAIFFLDSNLISKGDKESTQARRTHN